MEELANSITCEVSKEINQALYDKLNSYTKEQLIRIIMGDNAYTNVKHYGN